MREMTNTNDFIVVMAYFMVLSLHVFEGTEEQHTKQNQTKPSAATRSPELIMYIINDIRLKSSVFWDMSLADGGSRIQCGDSSNGYSSVYSQITCWGY